jgi:hypothetical protein
MDPRHPRRRVTLPEIDPRSRKGRTLLSAVFDLEPGFCRTDSKSNPETKKIKSGGQECPPYTGQNLSHKIKKAAGFPAASIWCAEHVRQLEGESPFDNLMEVKS